MENIFLTDITYVVTYYMSAPGKTYTKTHLVQARDEDEAIFKAKQFYKNKSIDYTVFYNVIEVNVCETII